MKKSLKIFYVIITTLIMFSSLSMSGCSLPEAESYLPEFEDEIYKYAVKTDDEGNKKCYIVGLTELGQNKTELILPDKINGIPVMGIGYKRRANPVWYFETVGCLRSDNLKKLYIPYDKEIAQWESRADDCQNGYPVVWKGLAFQPFTYKGSIVGYNLLSEYLNEFKVQTPKGFLANVSYIYNYENAENNGYYWVDSYDNKLITFIPPEPERESYNFGGWYKEPECINVWNFDVDETGTEIELQSRNFDDYDIGDITFLYAKWILN